MSRDEDLLRALSDLVRSEDPWRDPRLDDLAAGRLSPDQEQALLRELGPNAPMLDAFRPFEAGFKADLADKIAASMRASPAASARGGVRFLPRRAVVLGGAAATLAAAAALILLLRPHAPPDDPVPPYELVMLGGDNIVRSAPETRQARTARLAPGSRLEVRLRPGHRVQGSVALRGAVVRGADIRPWLPVTEVDPSGAIRVAGTREQLFAGLPDGEWTVVVAVGREHALPADVIELVRNQPSVPGDDASVRYETFRVMLTGTGNE